MKASGKYSKAMHQAMKHAKDKRLPVHIAGPDGLWKMEFKGTWEELGEKSIGRHKINLDIRDHTGARE